MKFIWQYLKNYRKILFGALALATVNQAFSLLDPQIFRLIVDRYLTHFTDFSRMAFFRGVATLLVASIVVALISRIAKNFQDYFVNVAVQRVGTKMYAAAVSHSFALPYFIFEDQRSGEHLLKLQKARTDAQLFITSAINILFFALVGIIFVLIYGFIVQPIIGLAYFATIPVLGLLTYFMSRKIKKAQSEIVSQTAALAGSTTETLRNVELVKSLGLEKQEIKRLNEVNDRILDLELKKIVIIRKFSFLQGTLINTLRSALLFLMIWLIFKQAITLGEFLSLYFYSFFIFMPLAELGTVTTQYQEALASSEKLKEIFQIKPEKKPTNPQNIGRLKEIKLADVSFSYNNSPRPVLDKIDLTVAAGETIALVGPSGSGKSTIVKLVAGLYRPSQGKISFNQIKADEIDFEQFRQKIGLVSQETQLFAGTIKDNLLFVKPNATDEECLRALNAAAAMSIIERGEGGLATKIGEGGLKISGGERQRLAIARALLREPELIIFDEATSSLDSITEKAITETIRQIDQEKPNRMTILIAHRLSTVLHADQIYVLEKGQIVEIGSHQNLLAKQGLYAALWREQQAESSNLAYEFMTYSDR